MKHAPLTSVFALTLFTSAFLLFSVQPMVSKMLLPLLGGGPSVWNTAMLFFQAMLLAGYAYAHLLARYVGLKGQAVLHIVLLAVFAFALPLSLPAEISVPEEGGQASWQLITMLGMIGGPFFILAASAPLFQHWFASSGRPDADNPYFLYAVSNAGSLGALLSYPFVVEPLLGLNMQTISWTGGYVLLIALTSCSAFFVRHGTKPLTNAALTTSQPLSWKNRLLWIGLSFIPSSLMLGVTAMITTDLASAPLFWVVPLALYLLTFIMAFARTPVFGPSLTRELSAYTLCLLVLFFVISAFTEMKFIMVSAHLAVFFLCALFCHQILAEKKPDPARLTEYFLLISLGGVLGGVFNALLAPAIFNTAIEYNLVLALVPFIIWLHSKESPAISLRFNAIEDSSRPIKLKIIDGLTILLGVALCAACFLIEEKAGKVLMSFGLFIYLLVMVGNKPVFASICALSLLLFNNSFWSLDAQKLAQERNYFGTLKIYAVDGANFLYHGTTLHGAQSQQPDFKLIPTTYYSPGGPASNLMDLLSNHSEKNIAGIGLGVGSIACLAAPGSNIDFYEIDPDIVRYASDPAYFSYLSDCGTNNKIILGDGRLKIAEQKDKKYDLVILDAFSSDNIPTHLITREAMSIYLGNLAEAGIIGINISNRYLDLRPMLSSMANDLGLTVYFKYHNPAKSDGVSNLFTASVYAALARKPEHIAPLVENENWTPYSGKKHVPTWTDDYANILSSFITQEKW